MLGQLPLIGQSPHLWLCARIVSPAPPSSTSGRCCPCNRFYDSVSAAQSDPAAVVGSGQHRSEEFAALKYSIDAKSVEQRCQRRCKIRPRGAVLNSKAPTASRLPRPLAQTRASTCSCRVGCPGGEPWQPAPRPPKGKRAAP